jgi:hypothetical protein
MEIHHNRDFLSATLCPWWFKSSVFKLLNYFRPGWASPLSEKTE